MWGNDFQRVLDDKKLWNRISWKDVCTNPCVDFMLLERYAPYIPMIGKHWHLHPDFPMVHLFGEEGPPPSTDWKHVSKTAPMSCILRTLEDRRYHWDFQSLLENPDMTPSILRDHFWPYLSHDVRHAILKQSLVFQHSRFSFEELCGEPYRLLNVTILSRHPDFSPEWFHRIPKRRWSEVDWKHLSRTMDPRYIQNTWNHWPWSISDLSHHPRLPFSLVLRFKKHKKWDWDGISLYVRLSTLVAYHHRFPFRYPIVSKNIHLRPWFVREHPTKRWDRIQLAMHPAMVPRLIWEDRLLFPIWRWDHVLRNPSLDQETLENMQRSFYQRLSLLKNHFHHDPHFRGLQATRIQTFFEAVHQRRLLQRKLAFLKTIEQRLPMDLWRRMIQWV